MKSKFTIVILNFNGSEDTLECVKSVLDSNFKNFEILVVDNNSKNEEYVKLDLGLKSLSNKIKLLRSIENKGFAGGNNLAIKNIDSDLVCFLNNDTIVEKNWLDKIIPEFDKDKNISIIQPKIKSFYNRNFFDYAGGAGGFLDYLGIPFSRGRVGFDVEEDCGQYDDVKDIFWSSGCCFFIRTDDLKKVSGFDEDFFLYFEEVDLCYRIKNLGKRIVFSPNSTIYHKGSKSTERENLNRVYFNHRNSLITLLKNMKISELVVTLPFRFIFDLGTAFFYLLNKNVKSFLSVFKAYKDIISNLPSILKKRENIQQSFLWDIQDLKIFSIQMYYQILNKKTFQDLEGVKKYKTKILTTYNTKNINFDLIYFLFSLLLTLIITSIWFWDGSVIYQSGEESLYMINPDLNVRAFSNGWYQTGYGYSMPVVIPRVPLFIFIYYLQDFGLSASYTQKILFELLLLSGLFFSFKFFKKITNSNTSSFIASLFYLLNIYSITQVWGRMLLTNVFLWAFLPLFLYFFHKIFYEKAYSFIILFIFVNLIYSFGYGLPSSVFVLWFIPVISLIFNPKKIREFLIFSISWLVSSLWWLIPYFTLKNEAFKSLENTQAAFDSLLGVSKYFKLEDVIYLHQQFLLTDSFNNLYNSTIFLWIARTLLLITILGIFKKFKYRFEYFTILLFSTFLILGTNTEYGKQFYLFIFEKFSASQILRNPYEKLGLIYLLAYSLFFGLGVTFIQNKISKKILKNSLVYLTVIVLFIYSFPYFNSEIFGFGKSETRVKIVSRYNDINNFLAVDNIESKYRILLYPLNEGDGAKIKFSDTIYNGIDPSEHLYNSTTYAKIVRVSKFDKDYFSLKSFFNSDTNEINYTILEEFHIGYIVVDFNYIDSKSVLRANIVKNLNNSPNFKLVYSNDGVYFYKFLNISSKYIDLLNCDSKIEQVIFKEVNKFEVLLNQEFTEDFVCRLILKEGFSENWELLINGKVVKNKEVYLDKFNSWLIPKSDKKSIEIQFNPYKIQ